MNQSIQDAMVEAFQFLEDNYSPKWTTGKGSKEKLLNAFSQNDVPKHTYLGYSGPDGLGNSFRRALSNYSKPAKLTWDRWLLLNINKFYCDKCEVVHSTNIQAAGKYICKSSDTARKKITVNNKRQLVLEYLQNSKGCQDCSETDPVTLDFDHRDPSTKLFNISDGYTRSEIMLLAEIAKCDIVCANCHRKRTAKLFSYYRHTNSQIQPV